MRKRILWSALGVLAVVGAIDWQARPTQAAEPLGVFTDHTDVGKPAVIGAGSASYDAQTRTYRVTGGGENMWAAADHFHYVWTKMSGDITIEADIAFVGTEPATGAPNAHRKACLVIRQSLDSDSAYVDAATHGDGLTSLQWRDEKGAVTHEVQSNVVGPKRLRLERRGDYFSMSLAGAGEQFQPAGGAAKLTLSGDFYVGLAVSSHDVNRRETVAFTDVAINRTPQVAASARTTLVNTLETISLQSRDRRVGYVATQPQRIEAPNWFPDSTNTLYFNTRGQLYRVQVDVPGGPPNPNRLKTPDLVPFGTLTALNNDHGVTRDGTLWAVSDQSQAVNGRRPSLVYTMPVGGGPVTRVTANGPSYFHGWSPDGLTLAYCGERDGNFDIYTVSVKGGEEKRLTTVAAKDDGPEFSPDGQFIYFNSDRSGSMQLWRMKADGADQEPLTSDTAAENWFPHISPNGQWIAFLTYDKGAGDHPENKDVRLRRMNVATRAVDELAKLFGGQGTINVSSWSPDGRYLAYVSYQVVPD